MSLTGFKNIDIDINEKLKKKSVRFLNSIKKYTFDNPVKSKNIEKGLHITGAEVRAIVRYLRNNHHPIGSKGDGYFFIKDESEKITVIKHLRERRNSLDRTITEMERINLDTNQLPLLLT